MKLALDTTHILGRGAVKDSYNLLADGIVQVLHGLAKLGPFEVMDLAEELGCASYVQGSSLKGQADVDWTNPQARQRFLAEIVADADRLLALVRGTRAGLVEDSAQDKELVAAAEVLARILAQDIERDDNGPRLKQGVASDRLISVHDPDMRHGRKSSSHRFNGHKAQVAVDTDSQLITAVEVLAGNAPDAEQALEVVEATEAATDCEVVEVIGDCAYGAGSTRAGTCTCPNQHTTRDLRPAKGGGGVFVLLSRPVRRAHCGPSARGVRAAGRCSSTRRKPCSSGRASCRPVRRSMKLDGDGRWWSTA
jgi:hypothetical protein